MNWEMHPDKDVWATQISPEEAAKRVKGREPDGEVNTDWALMKNWNLPNSEWVAYTGWKLEDSVADMWTLHGYVKGE